jgi:hypothetical protein
MRRAKIILAMTILSVTTATYAQSAPYYWWKSKIDGKRYCLQTSPGDGWARDSGPFKDARCSTPA